jgi:hypothetical protein
VTLRIAQAIFGERERGHRMLAASPSFSDAETLAGRMDLQGSPPPHAEWGPHFSGFPWNGHYVLARTVKDPSGTRGNMVFSRAFAIPEGAAGQMDDIGGLLELLEELGEAREAATDVEWRPGASPPVPSADLAAGLTADGSPPVVWASDYEFGAAVAGLWSTIWPAARLALRFRIAFSPADIASDPPTIVTTPPALVTRWSGYRVANPGSQPQGPDRAAIYLGGGARDGDLESLVKAFGDQMPNIRDLTRLTELEHLLTKGATFDGYLGAIRLAALLAPGAEQAEKQKGQLLDGAMRTLSGATIAEIRMARNLDLASFARREDFWDAVADWARSELWSELDADAVLGIVEESASDKPVEGWREAISTGLRAALSPPSATVAKRLWNLLERRPELLTRLARLSANQSELERALVAAAPVRLTADTGAALAGQSIALRMVSLHAACCAASLPAEEAIDRHLTDAPFDAASLALAASKAKGQELIAATLTHSEPQLLAMAIKSVAERPALLRKLEVADAQWRAIWVGALELNPDVNAGLSKAEAVIAELLDAVIDRRIADAPLLERLSATPQANLLGYRQRAALWPLLVEPALSRFRQSTAAGWLSAAERGEDCACEAPLAEEVVQPHRLDPTLDRLVGRPGTAFPLFRALPSIREARFAQWFGQVLARGPRFTVDDAAALGRLVAARSWRDVARSIADAITDSGRSDLRPAVEYIVEMVGTIRRWYLDETGSSTPVSAKWQVLLELLLELYGFGPRDTRIWQRAGGKDKDVPKGSSGADIWRKIISDAQKGKGDISVSNLVRVMYEDYPYHRAVEKLRWDSQFGARH